MTRTQPADDLTALARLHRSTDRATLRVAAVELARQGLTIRDISAALGLSESAVRMLLAPPEARALEGPSS